MTSLRGTATLAIRGGSPWRTRPFPTWPIVDATDEARVVQALRSGRWGRLAGDQVAEFEQRFARMHGCRYGIAMVNGTVSLRISRCSATRPLAPTCHRPARVD